MIEVVRLVVRHFARKPPEAPLIFAVDDTHLMDEYSWKCMPVY